MIPAHGNDNSDRTRIVVVMNSPEGAESIVGILRGSTDLEIVGTPIGVSAGLEWMRKSSANIVLVENGPDLVSFTRQARKISPTVGILLLSHAHDQAGAQQIIDALTAGAFDFAPVLGGGESVTPLLLSKIRCFSIKQYSRMAQVGHPTLSRAPSNAPVVPAMNKAKLSECDALLIGVSTGGPEALMELLPGLESSFPVPVVIVLHMPKEFTGAMAASLDRKCKLQVVEAQDGDAVQVGKAYLAQGGRHCLLERGQDKILRLKLGDGPPENGCRPAVDVLFRSAAIALGGRAVCVVLTGMGSDGTVGARELKQRGALVLVQDEPSSIVWGMPGSVVRAGLADEIVPLGKLASRLTDIVWTKR
jgi:two-component system chemotaxis response regulator CheB